MWKLGRQIEGICCCLLSSVKCERGKKKFIYKNKNAKWNYFNGCIFYVYGAAKKKNKRKLLSFGGGREEIFRIHQKNNAASE